jgi:Aerotolerance regulator N-terminal/von Willebrand factor type A domain
MDDLVIGQIGFASWPMLAWGIAAAIPVAIHLLRRHRRQSIPWAAMQLLQKVIDQQSKRARIQQLILLLVRILLLVTLALALARPFWNATSLTSSQLSARPSKLWLLVIDTSYSMGYRVSGQSRLERAKQQASQLVSNAPQGDAFALIGLDDPSKAIIGRATFDAQGTLSEIQRLNETARGCDLEAAIAIASDIVADCKANSNLPTDIEIVIFSDLGSDAWQSAVDGQVAKLLARLRQQVNLSVESFADSSPVNVAIESTIPSSNRPVVGSTISIEVTVASYGAAVKNLPVQLELDNQVVASETIDIQADQKKQIRFLLPIRSVGTSLVSIMLPADNLAIDNRRDLVVEAVQGNRVLIVEKGASKSSPWKLALRPLNSQSIVDDSNLRVVSEINWPTMSLKDWNVLIFNDIPIVDATWVSRLSNYVEAGGAVVFAFGRNSMGTAVGNEAVSLSLQGLLGCQFLAASENGDWTIDPLDYGSPIVAPFEGFPNSGLLTMPIFRYWQIDKLDKEAIVDLAMTTGDPFVLRRRLGRGWVASILSAPEDGQSSTGNESWNAITTWPSFLPLAQQLIQAVSESDAQLNNRFAGETISDRLPPFSQVQAVKLQRPDQTEVQIACTQPDRAGRAEWVYADTNMRGVYQITDPSEAQRQFAINIQPLQSSLQSIDLQSIRPLLSVPSTSVTAPNDRAISTGQNDRLARLFLLLLAGLLIVESLLAWAIGKRIE